MRGEWVIVGLDTGLMLMRRRNIDGSVQERRNSIANALELRISCTNPSIYEHDQRWYTINDYV